MIFFLVLRTPLKKTNDFVFLLPNTVPTIMSLSLVGAIKLTSKEIVTQGFPFAKVCAAVPTPASMIEQMYPPCVI